MAPNITDWSDFELNKAIAESLGIYYADDEGEVFINDNNPVIANYCNNWNDLMPLVVEHDIKMFGQIDLARCWEIRYLAECLYLVLLAKQDQDNEHS